MASKGKQIAGKEAYSGYRKRNGSNSGERSGRGRKRKNRGVIQFFEDAAEVDDHDESSNSDDSDLEEEFDPELKIKNEPGKAHNLPLFPKEEEPDEEEFDRMMEERYKNAAGFVKYAEDDYEAKRSIERNSLIPPAKDPVIWKVKCTVGRERHSAFCLMQKFVDLQSLGTKLQIISAFAVEHTKGFVYIEADKQCDVIEACKGLCSIYSTRMTVVPNNEVSHLLSFQSKYNEVSEGMWARVKNGKYKGDLAQVVVMNDARKKATIKLIPRIDLQAMAQKYGGGVTVKKGIVPTPRLISSNELEEFRPLIQHRRDRDTGKIFEVFDGLMLKDGYLYKKISIDSLSCWGVTPSEQELLKFKPSENNESDDLEWLSQLYGERKKTRPVKIDKGGEKGEGSSGSSVENSFETHDLVCFGRKDFGLIIGKEKDDCYKILKEGSEGPVVVTVETKELKNGPLDTKFTALDQHMKTISINDIVKVSEGPSKLQGRQGIVKQVYRGTIFLYDENETENGGYFCCKSQICEKIKLSIDACNEKGGESGASGFGDFLSSPKSPLSPKKPWEARESNTHFNRGDKDSMFSVGQTLRIRVGPLKGYICRVLAIRYSDVTVKLDSQHKVLTVRCEHLAEVREKSSTMSMSDDTGSSSFKPFDLLGTEGCSGGWMDRAGTSAEPDPWNAGGRSAERSAWPSFPASGISAQPDKNLFGSEDNDPNDSKGTAWELKVTPHQNSSWGTAAANEKPVDNSDQVGGWNSWSKGTLEAGSGSVASDGWGKATVAKAQPDSNPANLFGSEDNDPKGTAWESKVTPNQNSSWGTAAGNEKPVGNSDQVGGWNCWSKSNPKAGSGSRASDGWGKAAVAKAQTDSKPANLFGSEDNDPKDSKGTAWERKVTSNQNSSWGTAAANEKPVDNSGQVGGWNCWSKGTVKAGSGSGASDGWGKAAVASGDPNDAQDNWGQTKCKTGDPADSLNDAAASWGKNKNVNGDEDSWKNSGESWVKGKKVIGIQDGGSGWSKRDGGSGWGKQDGGSSWSKQDGGSSWSKQADQEAEDGSKRWKNQDGGWSRTKSSGGGHGFGDWNKGGMENKVDREQHGNWERPQLFDRGRGSGGRRGGFRGGRDQFGRGRSFDHSQSSGWNKLSQESNVDSGTGTAKWGSRENFSEDAAGLNKDQSSSQGQTDSWSKPDGGTSWNKQDGGSNWGKQDGGSWGKKDGGYSWSKKDGGSSWGKQDGSSGWGKQDGSSGWGKQERSSGLGKQDGGAWGKNDGGSSWGKQDGSCGLSKQDEGAWVKKDGGSSWGKQDGSSGWGKQDGSSGLGKQDGGAWGKRDGVSSSSEQGGGSWSKQDGGSSWSKQADRTTEGGPKSWKDQDDGWNRPKSSSGDQGFNGWNKGMMENKAEREQPRNWERPLSFDRGRGSGGRRGGFHGGRNQFGRGRTFDHSQSSGWNKQGQENNWTSDGGNNDQAGSWGKSKAFDGGREGSWNKTNASGDDSGSNWQQGWGADNNRKSSDASGGGQWSSWGQSSTNKEVKETNVQGGGWNKGSGGDTQSRGWDKQGTSWNGGGGSGNWGVTGDKAKNLNQSNTAAGGQSSSLGHSVTNKEVKETNVQGGGWNKGSGGGAQSVGWDKQGTSWNEGRGSGNCGASGDQAKSLNQSDAAEGTSGGGGQTDSWGKAAGSSWGKGNGGGDKGGW